MSCPRTALALVCAGLLPACATGPFEGKDYEDTRGLEPLPFVVRINEVRFLAETRDDMPPEATGETTASPLPSIARPQEEPTIRRLVKEGLERYRVFPLVLDGDEEADVPADLELDVTVRADPARWTYRSLGERELTNDIYWNLIGWLALGFPGWFRADTIIDPAVDLEYSFSLAGPGDGQQLEREALSGNVDLAAASNLAFVDRASLTDYLFQLFIPPFLVPPDREATDQSLRENCLVALQRESGRMKKSIWASLFAWDMPLVLRDPGGGSGGPAGEKPVRLIFFCDAPLSAANIDLALRRSAGGGTRVVERSLWSFEPLATSQTARRTLAERFRTQLDQYDTRSDFLKGYSRAYLLTTELRGVQRSAGDLLRVSFRFDDSEIDARHRFTRIQSFPVDG